MPTLNIAGRKVKVDDSFFALSPEEQNATVDEIADSIGITAPEGGDGGNSRSDKKAPPELTAGRAAGLGGRIGVEGAIDAVLGTPALVGDYLRSRVYEPINTIQRLAGYEETPWEGMKLTTKADNVATGAADALGLPTPETDMEKLAVGAGRAATSALTGAGLARTGAKVATGLGRQFLTSVGAAPGTQAGIAALTGGGAQMAQNEGFDPLLGAGIGLAGGIAGAHAIPAIRATGRALDNTFLRSAGAQERAAASRLRDAAADPERAFQNLQNGGDAELVPGSAPTTFQATRDEGIGRLERQLRTTGEMDAQGRTLGARADEQNAARVQSLKSIQPDGQSADLVQALRDKLDEIDSVTRRYEAAARSRAENAADEYRPTNDAEGLGGSVRSSMLEAEKTAKENESALWKAIDPDGTLMAPSLSTRETVRRVYDKLTPEAQLGISRNEREIVELLRTWPESVSFQRMMDVSSQIKERMSEALRFGRNKEYGRLAQLNQTIRGAMERSAGQRLASDPAAGARFQAYANDFQAGSPQGGSQGSTEAVRSVRAGTVSPVGREAGYPGRGPGSSAGAAGVQSGTPGTFTARQLNDAIEAVTGRRQAFNTLQPKEAQAVIDHLENPRGGFTAQSGGSGGRGGKPLSLTQFIAKNGGLALDGDAAAADFGNLTVPGYGKLARPNGRSIDGYWRNKLIDEGYLSPDADGYSSRDITRELFRRIEEERAGRKSYSVHDESRIPAGGGEEDDLRAAASQIRDELQAGGVRPRDISSRALNDAAERLARGEEKDAVTAYERAVMNLEDEGPVGYTYEPRESSSAGSILDGYRDDPGAGSRYRAATDATKERKGTFGRGYVGPMLRRAGTQDTFTMGNTSVAANVFHPGATGGERVKAALKAGANPSDIADLAALSLNKKALRPDGTLDPTKYEAWRKMHEAALRELPEDVRARFSSASLATQALDKVSAARKAQLDAYCKSVLGKLANIDENDLPAHIGRVIEGQNAAAQLRSLVQATKGSPSARLGLRRAIAEHIEKQYISTKAAGTSTENGVKTDAFAKFIKAKKPALVQVFGADELRQMEAIAEDIRRSELSLHGTRLPGNSNSAGDLSPMLEKMAEKIGGKASILAQVVGIGLGAHFGDAIGAIAGSGAAAGGKYLIGRLRAAGIQRVDQLVVEAMLDPQVAKSLLAKVPLSTPGGRQILGRALARLSPIAAGTVYAGGSVRQSMEGGR